MGLGWGAECELQCQCAWLHLGLDQVIYQEDRAVWQILSNRELPHQSFSVEAPPHSLLHCEHNGSCLK